MTLPLTIADWAATEGRFRKHFKPLDQSQWNEDAVPFHEYLDLSAADRQGKTAYIVTVDRDKHLARLAVSNEIVLLAEERQQLWSQLRELAGLVPSASVRDRLVSEVEADYERKLAGVRAEYEAKLAELPKVVARRMADVLLRGGAGKSVVDLLSSMPAASPVPSAVNRVTVAPIVAAATNGKSSALATSAASAISAAAAVAVRPASAPALAGASAAVEEDLAIDPYIDSARCTSCNECTNLNGRLFAYNDAKQAAVRDAAAGTFQQLVVAAERCPVGIIHPGTPRNPKEKDLAKWLKRAEPFA
jgi:pyruvate-ferredoxin/flavodoxin oxidoreductase